MPSCVVSRDAVEERRGAAGRSAATKPSGHRCWWTSYVVTPVVVRSGSPWQLLEGKRHLLVRGEVRDALRTKARPARHGPECRYASELDGLGRDHELDRNDSRTEVEHLGQASRSERRGGAVPTPDSCIVEASLERDGCASSRASAAIACGGDAELESPSCQVPSVATSPSLRPLNRGLSSFSVRSTAAVSTGASAMRRKSSAAASGCESKFLDRYEPLLCLHDEGIPLVGVGARLPAVPRRTSARRASRRAPAARSGTRSSGGRPRPPPTGCCRRAGRASDRGSRGSPGTVAQPRSRAARRCSPGRPRSRGRRRCSIQVSSARASATASAAWPVENEFPARSASASPASSSVAPSAPCARSAFCARSAWPTVPSERTAALTGALSAATSASATSGRHPGIPRRPCWPVEPARRVRRPPAPRPEAPSARIAERLNACARPRPPCVAAHANPVVTPYAGVPAAAACSTIAPSGAHALRGAGAIATARRNGRPGRPRRA